jgi:hypothetical protein
MPTSLFTRKGEAAFRGSLLVQSSHLAAEQWPSAEQGSLGRQTKVILESSCKGLLLGQTKTHL